MGVLLGQVQVIEAKRLFSRDRCAPGGTLEFSEEDGALRIFPAADAVDSLRLLDGWRVVSLVYATDRFEPRPSEIGGRKDGRPWVHVFTHRPELLWDAAARCAVLPRVAMARNQLGQPTFIEG